MNAVLPDAAAASADRLRITEIFLSLQGEARSIGLPTVFVRLTGCPLRCQYCDTAYAFHGGQWRGIDDIVSEVAGHGVRYVCVTGGEPLAQKRCIGLLQRYPTHDKAPGAMLKVGLSQLGQQQLDAAERTLDEVTRRYPGTDAARVASDRLSAIQLGRLR